MLIGQCLVGCLKVAALPVTVRAAATVLRGVRSVSTADLCDQSEDAMTSSELKVMAVPFRSFGGRAAFHGQAKTIKCFENNPLVRQTLEQPGENRVLVVDGGGSTSCALMGDNLASIAHANQWAGVVIHGCVRDSAQLKTIDIGVFAIGTHPRRSGKAKEGCVDETLLFGEVQIRNGDWVYCDSDGVVVATTKLHSD